MGSLSRWITDYDKLKSNPKKKLMNGVGRKSNSRFFEDKVVCFVKDLRREEKQVTVTTIINNVRETHPEFTRNKYIEC